MSHPIDKKKLRKKQLTFKYLLAVSIIFFLSLSTLAALQYVLGQQENYASIINISGRQRMLSQRTTMLVLHYYSIPESDKKHLEKTREKLMKSVQLMEESHQRLTSGKLSADSQVTLSPAVNRMYFGEPMQVDTLVLGHINTIRTMLADPGTIEIEKFLQNASTILLSSLDEVVKQYEGESNRYTTILQITESAVFFATCLVLLGIIFFIFRPMVGSVVETENVLNNMLDNLPVYMDIVNEDGIILYQSKYLADAMGGSTIGRRCYEVYKDDGLQCRQCPLKTTIQESSNIMEVSGCLGGRTLQVAHVQIPFRGQKAILETFTDITQQRQTEQLLIQVKEAAENASQMKSEFLATMSHELKTPMNAIIGLAYLTLETEVSFKQRDYLNKISSSANQLLGLISELLDFAKIETNIITLKMSSFNLADVMDNLSSITTCDALEKGLEVNLNIEPEVPLYLVGDHQRLEQILGQLIKNAVKFTNEGHIDINTEHVKTEYDLVCLRFSVNDTGIGVDPNLTDRLFEPFSQGEGSSTRLYGGTGLGLAVCKELVALMGGEIQLETKSEPGSLFTFTANFSLDDKSGQKNPEIPEITGLKALVVDDHPMACRSVEHMLNIFHMQTKSVGSAEEALDELECANKADVPYDFMITDWQMPGMDGIKSGMQIRANPDLYGNPAIILVTAFSKEEAVQRVEEEFDGLVLKPVNRAVLLGTILAAEKERLSPSSFIPTNQNMALPSSLTGIDIERGQAQVGGNRKMYFLILKKFVRNQTGQIDAIRQAQSSGDIETARRLTHTLKGIAGNIGALKLQNAALQMEKELSIDTTFNQSHYLNRLNILDISLQEVLKSINSLIFQTKEEEEEKKVRKDSVEIDPSVVDPIIEKLINLLMDSDTEAEKYLERLAGYLEQTLMADQLELLREAIGQYEFEEALEIVNLIRLQMNR